jgi:uncharacterized phage-associated protein
MTTHLPLPNNANSNTRDIFGLAKRVLEPLSWQSILKTFLWGYNPREVKPVVSALDVAQYILRKAGPVTAMKLQKLVYYSQAWSLVWDERPMFSEAIEAWERGPVIRELYSEHKGMFVVAGIPKGDPEKLDDQARETVDAVLKHYKSFSAQQLSDLTHMEAPWVKTRETQAKEIAHDEIAEYYGTIAPPNA